VFTSEFVSRLYFADTEETCIRSLLLLQKSKCLAIDCEGIDLSRKGELCIIQIVDEAAPDVVHLFDVCALGNRTFDVAPAKGCSLKAILESASVRKLFWDVRNDNDALFNLHAISTANVVDLQLIHILYREQKERSLPANVSGLQKALSKMDIGLSRKEDLWIDNIKSSAKEAFAPERGGSYEIWKTMRPLSHTLLAYCTDAKLFFPLLRKLDPSGSLGAIDRCARATAARLACARNPGYSGRSREHAYTDAALRG
jgi:exonuclease 3'-5' domain-containing protein 1